MNKILLILSASLLLVTFGNNSFAESYDKLAVLETNLGTIVIEFFPDDAPKHVDNFIRLTESGFYDGVLFHRIIPGFMIQGGDPNTISGDSSTWGTGGPSTSVDAEFNTIKHNRGIVSMARSVDPNSGGSQFFIVHGDSNFLDEQYTVFGRIVTEESFKTLDKIASVETASQDKPQDPEQVKITKIIIVNRSEVSNILELQEPERIESTITPSTGNQIYENNVLDIAFTAPEGWLLQQPEKISPISPDIRIVGPVVDGFNPNFILTISNINEKTIDDLIIEKNELLSRADNIGLELLSQEKITINEKQAYVTIATQNFELNNKLEEVKFKEVMITIKNNSYTFAYGNTINNFDNEILKFDEFVNSFKILSEKESLIESNKEGGGCLIATATFGSELAPQVQQLREFRDNTILSTESGTIFMSGFNQFYYSFSPIIADLERENPIFKEVVKLSITPMLSTLSILNYAEIDSEEEMLSYGIGIILINIGMYFVAPTIIIYKIRK